MKINLWKPTKNKKYIKLSDSGEWWLDLEDNSGDIIHSCADVGPLIFGPGRLSEKNNKPYSKPCHTCNTPVPGAVKWLAISQWSKYCHDNKGKR